MIFHMKYHPFVKSFPSTFKAGSKHNVFSPLQIEPKNKIEKIVYVSGFSFG